MEAVFFCVLEGQKRGGHGTTKSMDETKDYAYGALALGKFGSCVRRRVLISVRSGKVELMAQNLRPSAFKSS